MTIATHTPIPWILSSQYPNCIKASDKTTIATTDNYFQHENARHIVKCVNRNDELIDLLVRTLDAVNVWQANEAPLLLSEIKAAIGWGE